MIPGGEPIRYKGLVENLQSGAKDVNEGFRGIPHIVIGGNKERPRNNSPYQDWKRNKGKPNFEEDPIDRKIAKAKKWGLILLVLLIIGYSLWRIIKLVILK